MHYDFLGNFFGVLPGLNPRRALEKWKKKTNMAGRIENVTVCLNLHSPLSFDYLTPHGKTTSM